MDFLLFTVISLLLSTMLIVCYSMALHTAFTGEEIGSFSWYSYSSYPNQNMLRVKIFTILVLILGCFEFLLCVVSIGYFAYSYRRDYWKVSNRLPFKPMLETDLCYRGLILLQVYISLYDTRAPSGSNKAPIFKALNFAGKNHLHREDIGVDYVNPDR